MIAVQGYYREGRLELAGEAPAKQGNVLVIFQDEPIAKGKTVLKETPSQVLREAQAAFAGAAEVLGVSSDDDVQALVNEVRYGR